MNTAKPTTVTIATACETIQRRQTVRIYAETSALKLLGIQDKYEARVAWKERLEKAILPTERATLENVRAEIERRSQDEMAEAQAEFSRRNKVWSYFPDEGPYRRELYPRHMEFIDATRTDDEVKMMAANKTGKTQLGAHCVANWATGRYPRWWMGRVFNYPIIAWVCNKTAKDCRDINEQELLGPTGNEQERGTGMIPSHLIGRCTPKPGTPHGFEIINVEHVSGGMSYIVTKSYDQGRTAFQGRNVPVIWNDEEVEKDIYDEELLRIMIVEIEPSVKGSGIIIGTYTPIQGLTEETVSFMESAGFSIEAMRRRMKEGLSVAD